MNIYISDNETFNEDIIKANKENMTNKIFN